MSGRIILVVVLVLAAASCGDGSGDADDVAGSVPDAPISSNAPETTVATTTTTTVVVSETDDDDAHEASHDDADDASDESHDDAEAAHDDDSDEDVAADGPVVIIMTEFAFEPASITVSAGETVTFEVVNKGSIPHEFRLSNAHRVEEHLATGHDDHGDDGGHHGEDGDVFIELEAGDSGHLTVTFPEDTTVFTEIACLLPGHYEAGMLGEVVYV